MERSYYSFVESPVGQIVVRGDGQFLTGLFMPQHTRFLLHIEEWEHDDTPFASVREQLDEYFAGSRKEFDVPIRLIGTPFQQKVWEQLLRIPFGSTLTYGELAHRIGRPTASRAVGHANGRNPISIVVPCHRVIGMNGKLTGYGGGLDNKQRLLTHESATGDAFDNSEMPNTSRLFALS